MRRVLNASSLLFAATAAVLFFFATALTVRAAFGEWSGGDGPDNNYGCGLGICGLNFEENGCVNGGCENSPFCYCKYSASCYDEETGDYVPCCTCEDIN